MLGLLASAAAPLLAQQRNESGPDLGDEIIVIGDLRALQGVQPERSLDADLIDAYGVSTVGELFDQIIQENGDADDEPVLLVNGERVSDLRDAADYPVEAVSRVEVFPRGSATRVGGSPQRRVISITLRNQLRTLALTAGYRVATEGDWDARRGEAILTRISGPRRINIALRVRDESDLLESDRGIVQPTTARPFDLVGNVIADPRLAGSEIDPALSLLAGTIVTRAAVPEGTLSPTLQSFAANANRINESDLGRFRTLRPDSRNYQLSLSAADRLTPWLRSTVQARLDYNEGNSLLGLPSAIFLLPVGNTFSPFTRDVAIAAYGADPLRRRSRGYSGNVTVGLNANVDNWDISFTGSYFHADRRFRTQRQDGQSLAAPILIADPARNPFAGDLGDLLAILSDSNRSLSNTGNAQLRASGSPFSMPAGMARLTVGAELSASEVLARNTFAASRRYRRSQRGAFANGELPLTSRRAGVLPAIGDLSAVFELGVADISDYGTLTRYAYGLNWQPRDRLRIVALENRTRRAPDTRVLADPILITPAERYFDFLTGTTVDVTQISGGNPALRSERIRTRRLGINAGPFTPNNLRLNGEYSSTVSRDVVASLPPASAAVLAAFPDRFQRDASGTLTTVDIRSVNFARERLEQIRYGFNIVVPIGGARARPAGPAADDAPAEVDGEESAPPARVPASLASRMRLQLAASHTMLLTNDIVIRPTLPRVDLLDGGAIGIGGAPSRHQVNVNMTLGGRGMGATMIAVWRSESNLIVTSATGVSQLRFDPLTTVNLRAFVAGSRLFPGERWARSTRLSVSISNALNDRQNVRDAAGLTPLRYQAGYRDAIGRTIEFEIRKVF